MSTGGGSAGGGAPPIDGKVAAAGTTAFGTGVVADANDRFVVAGDGSISWGSGAAAIDAKLERGAAGIMQMRWQVGGTVRPILRLYADGAGTGYIDLNQDYQGTGYPCLRGPLNGAPLVIYGGSAGGVVIDGGSGTALMKFDNANKLSFFNAAVAAKPAVAGSRAANAALASLLTGLATLGLVTDNSTA